MKVLDETPWDRPDELPWLVRLWYEYLGLLPPASETTSQPSGPEKPGGRYEV